MVKYDPAIIQKYAQRLYDGATMAVITWPLGGALVGGVTGIIVSESFRPQSLGAVIAYGALFGLFGIPIGIDRAFRLRLLAQMTLCQAQIEANTRP